MRWLRLLALMPVILLAGCGRTLSPDEARGLLQRVQTARQSASLQARLVTSVRLKDTVLRSEALLRRAPGLVQMQYLTGRFAGWRVYEQDGMVWRVDPQGKAQPSPGGAEPGGMGLRLTPDLTVRHEGPGLAAWRRVERYTIAPGNAGQARLRLAVDARTGYPLRSRRYDLQGQLLSATTYRRVDYRAAPPQRVSVPPEASHPEPQAGKGGRAQPATNGELEKMLGGPLLQPKYIPAGFQPRGGFIHHNRRRQFAELRYSDGLRTLAVIQFHPPGDGAKRPSDRAGGDTRERRGELWRRLMQARGPGARPGNPSGQQRPGGLWRKSAEGRGQRPSGEGGGLWRSVLRGNVVRERRGDRIVLVMGELPEAELQKVMASIPLAPGQRRPGVHF